MNNENNIIPPSPTSPPPSTNQVGSSSESSRSKLSVVILILAPILIAGGIVGGYWYGKQKSSSKSVTTSTSQSVTTSSGVHFSQSENRPFNLTSSKLSYTTKLGVPSNLQVVRTTSTNNNLGDSQIYTNLNNNELGRWVIGDPTNPGDNGGGNSEIAVYALSNSWQNSDSKDPQTVDAYDFTTPLVTAADKLKFMKDIAAQSSTCAKNPAKGFITDDGNLNVCYYFNYGKEGYSPTIYLEGYGVVKDQPILLEGSINIYDTTGGTTQADQQKTIASSLAGSPTATTAAAGKAIISAIKQTTITTATAATN